MDAQQQQGSRGGSGMPAQQATAPVATVDSPVAPRQPPVSQEQPPVLQQQQTQPHDLLLPGFENTNIPAG